ncbi:starch phosphorylase [Rhizoctonia solani AG-1 IB]|uniref:Alpha-1,4 glucan phosphorylase n=1 Tax=Thanatephorus cucumeris (strain AG1-IB / isolate 7/3/14) TaxID=1108050 RepID=M5CG87_THACB|nr:starch phosphorylase [Rhizoctonia solani AG-1 IB]CEL62313.1 starch phosphorylase [Rhizoctonia solani AG-1 IB]
MPQSRRNSESFQTIDTAAIGKPAEKPVRKHKRSATGYIPATEGGKEVWPLGDEKVWKAGIRGVSTTKEEIASRIVNHVQTTIARQAYNLDDQGAYQAVAYATRDELLVNWNDTQMNYTRKAPKRAYYLSLEWLMGRTLDNALLNLGLKDKYRDATNKLGFNLEDLLEHERDAGLGNGGLGRLAACYVDSSASQELPFWGYGLRYHYGIFQQLIAADGSQLEAPDPWLNHANPWEVARHDVTYDIRFYGQAERIPKSRRAIWSGGQEVAAVAYDVPIPGYATKNTNNLRLWDARGKSGFDLQSFNAGDYEKSVESSNSAENITRVLYPNDNHMVGKELRLKQQYFWCAASLADILRRFKNLDKPITEFPDYVAIQLNDTHPTLAIPELMRILVDEEELEWDQAWDITSKTFGYTNHTVLPEALEKWAVPLLQHLLPRHMQIVFDLNFDFLKKVEKKFPGEREKIERLSLIQEGYPQYVRMANLAVIGSRKVNGVAELHSELVRTTILKDFVDYYGADKFGNVTNGITPRRWLDQCNPSLSNLITETLGGDKSSWLKDLYKLKGLLKYADDSAFQAKWTAAKQKNKERLAHYARETLGVEVDTKSLFDVQIKRIHEYKRQTLNIFGVVYRYLNFKSMTPEERKKQQPRTHIFGGKAAPGYYMAKLTIRLIVNVAKVVNNDPDVKGLMTVIFCPDYSVSLAEILIPAADISEHISTAGTEAAGTSNMKFCLNGALLLGTVDGANIEIAEEAGEEKFFFGHLTPAVEDLRYQHAYHPVPVEEKSPALASVLTEIGGGRFGDGSIYEPLLNTVRQSDYYLITEDFDSYVNCQTLVDQAYKDKASWTKKSITTVANMGKFSSDRCILDYAESYWNVEAVKCT